MRRNSVLTGFAVLFACTAGANAAIAADNQELLDRIEALEKKVDSSAMGSLQLGSGVTITPYGFVRFDAAYDDSADTDAIAVAAPYGDADESSVGFTAEVSRIGLKLDGPEFGANGKLAGKVETDFFGEDLRLRQAYIDLNFTSSSIRAGKTWDFWAPRNSSTLNFSALWYAGNIGDRNNALYGTIKPVDGLKIQAGLIDTDNGDDRRAGFPAGAAFIGYDAGMFSVGIGGLIGQTEPAGMDSQDVQAFTFGVTIKPVKMVTIVAEAYIGTNLYNYRSSLGGSPALTPELDVTGGFAEVQIRPVDNWTFTFGGGLDDTDDITYVATEEENPLATVVDSNQNLFASVKYAFAKNFVVGLEYQMLETDYVDSTSSDSNRVQLVMLYKF
jgi:hypothetical protein